jgi:molybdopterin-guanine dinucleotide biosynthesis protein A
MAGSVDGRRGGVVLAGGRSTRMGAAKAALEWHGSTLLRRTVGILARATGGPVVVVRAAGQDLPALPAGTVVVEDPRAGLGPLQGIAAGLSALRDEAAAAFVSATDLPFLHPAFVNRVLRALDGPPSADVALPVAHGYPQPLAAGYRTMLAGPADRLVAADRLRPAFLFAECSVHRLDGETLRADGVLAALDPGLESLSNVNTPDDYATARARLPPAVTVHIRTGTAGPRLVRAATVRGAADAVGVTLGGRVAVTLNDVPIASDPEAPLATGDRVTFGPLQDDLPRR